MPPGGGDIQEVCRLGLQTLTLFEVQLFILLPCLRQQSLFYAPDSFRSHSGLNNFQINMTKWASLNRITKIHVRLSRLRGVKQKRSHWDSGTNNSFLLFHSSQPRNQEWILVIQNYLLDFLKKKIVGTTNVNRSPSTNRYALLGILVSPWNDDWATSANLGKQN